MNIGIVGHEAAKFTAETKVKAQEAITEIIDRLHYEHGQSVTVVSGHCHLGGIDIWAEEIAVDLDCETLIFPPTKHQWEPNGYKERNIKIAQNSDIIYVIVVKSLPSTYKGMRFAGCYHCDKPTRKHIQIANTNCATPSLAIHVKSGACWTAWWAVEKLGKLAKWIII